MNPTRLQDHYETHQGIKFWTKPSVEVWATTGLMMDAIRYRGLNPLHRLDEEMDELVELAGRACYQSFKNAGGKTNEEYLAHILEMGHGSVLEHGSITLYIQGISRTLTHELVRHRAGCAYSQLSQRYVADDIGMVFPPAASRSAQSIIIGHACSAVKHYRTLLELHGGGGSTMEKKRSREMARSVLPGCTETKLVITANLRAWRHILAMRGSTSADAEIRRLTHVIAANICELASSTFQDVFQEGEELVLKHPKV